MIQTDFPSSAAKFAAIRRDIHAHPELGFEEHRTAGIVADLLKKFGYEVAAGIGGTGVVGTLRKGSGAAAKSIGLRADMDALPIEEKNNFAHRSTRSGVFHGCGHDGHTAMLLAAAAAIGDTPFDGVVHLIFQPAEEGLGGAKAMIDDGLFDRFPCDYIFGLHNMPGAPVGAFALRQGPFLASSDRFRLTLEGRGGHVGMPHLAADPISAAAHIIVAWQGMLSRRTNPGRAATMSVTQFNAGETDNAIPDSAMLSGSIRTTDPETHRDIEIWLRETAEGVAAVFGVSAKFERQIQYPVLVNHADGVEIAMQAAIETAGADNVDGAAQQIMGSEDFAFMLKERPGAYILLGAGAGRDQCMVHDPNYDFNDALIPIGAAYWRNLVLRALAPQ